jgi:hypothetical protein
MIEPFQLLKRQMLIAPLGLRFWDVATGAYVSNGLRVTAYPDNDRLHMTQASPNRSGTYVLHQASGLREFEMGVGNPQFTDSLPERQPFTVEVRDEERRFLPLKFEAHLPCKGLFEWQKAMTEPVPLDLAGSPSVPLFSSILRAVPAGMAVLRAELYESPSEEINEIRITKPAAWAMVEARSGGRLLGRGIADERGRIALIFAYPTPQDSIISFGSSPAGPFEVGPPFQRQEWTIQLQAYYEPTALSSPPAPLSPPQPSSSLSKDDASIPKLSDVLQQSPVSLFLDEAQTEPLTEVTLMYGPKVVVPVFGSPLSSPPNPVPLSNLFVSRAA